jgi:hypothetical protein
MMRIVHWFLSLLMITLCKQPWISASENDFVTTKALGHLLGKTPNRCQRNEIGVIDARFGVSSTSRSFWCHEVKEKVSGFDKAVAIITKSGLTSAKKTDVDDMDFLRLVKKSASTIYPEGITVSLPSTQGSFWHTAIRMPSR